MIPDSVIITENVGEALKSFLNDYQYSNIAVLVDEHTEEHCLPLILEVLPEHWLIKIQSGEENKTIQTCEKIWSALTEAAVDRHGLLINLGGGVIGDMGGFCASTFKRGIDFINLPTTLLAQVDASVGGKLGVDFGGLKNHIGLFRDPEKVMVSSKFLQTLPKNELRSGFAEVIKHALIADGNYWHKIREVDFSEQDWSAHIEHSIGIKSSIVSQDPTEKGLRKLLNFGHTVGHAIETLKLKSDGPLLHGEAVAIGMICESHLSMKKCGLSESTRDEIAQYILEIFGKCAIDKKNYEEILHLSVQDKKNLKGVINCTLIKGVGEGVVDVPITKEEILDSLFYYDQLNE